MDHKLSPLPSHGPDSSPARVVERFWELMRGNDFTAVGEVLADGFVCEWPQSAELIRGRHNFAAVNAEYPTQGRWTFDVVRLVEGADGEGVSTVVTDTIISDGAVTVRAVSFFTVEGSLITHLREYWPAHYPAPANRAHLVEPLD